VIVQCPLGPVREELLEGPAVQVHECLNANKCLPLIMPLIPLDHLPS
jgi:hypothetical protein